MTNITSFHLKYGAKLFLYCREETAKMVYLFLEEEAHFWAVNPTPGAHWFGRGLIYFWLSFEFAKASVLKDAEILQGWSPWNSSASTQQAPATTSHLVGPVCMWPGGRVKGSSAPGCSASDRSCSPGHWWQPALWSWSRRCWRKIRNLKEGMIKRVEKTKKHSLLIANRRNLIQTNPKGESVYFLT